MKASPYFMAGLERFERFPGSPDARLLERKLAQKGAHNIAWLYTRRQGIFTSGRRPLRELEDFRGIKLRGVAAVRRAGRSRRSGVRRTQPLSAGFHPAVRAMAA
ncbi:MAG: hypothetical protein PHQ14_11800 [Chromatiales bacterium]|nr:hypothetical protein [Chromatiales bacterium]